MRRLIYLIGLLAVLSFKSVFAVNVTAYTYNGSPPMAMADLCPSNYVATTVATSAQISAGLFRGWVAGTAFCGWSVCRDAACTPANGVFASGTIVTSPTTYACTTGTTKNLTSFQSNTSPQTIYIGSGPNLSDGLCEYTCPSSTTDGLTYYTASGNYNIYACTATGAAKAATTQGLNTIPSTAKSVQSTPATSTASGSSCVSTSTQSTVCQGGSIPTGCYTVDGYLTCQSATGSTINNNVVASTDSKNCVQTGNDLLCNVPTNDPTAEYCGTVNNVKQCFSKSAYKQTKSVATITNADGSKTVTTTTENNVLNGGKQTQVDQYNSSGQLTSSNITGTLSGTPQPKSNNDDVVKKLDEIKKGLETKDTTEFTKNTDIPRTFGQSNELLKAKFLQHLSIPSFSTSNADCPVFSQYIPFLNKTLTIDQFCSMDPLIRPVLNAISTGFWLLLGLIIILRA